MGFRELPAMFSSLMPITWHVAQQSCQTVSSFPKDKALLPQEEGLVYVSEKISIPEKIKTTIFKC